MFQLQNASLVLISLSAIISLNSFHFSEALNNRNYNSRPPDHDTIYVHFNDSIQQQTSYYKNGNIKYRNWSIYDRQEGNETRRIVHVYRKNGERRYTAMYIVKPGYGALVIYEGRYDPHGNLVGEQHHRYDKQGIPIEEEECDQ